MSGKRVPEDELRAAEGEAAWQRRCAIALKALEPSLTAAEIEFLAQGLRENAWCMPPVEAATFAAQCIQGGHMPHEGQGKSWRHDDHERIDVIEDHELLNWAWRFGVTPEELRRVVAEVMA
jgi:hypothetical protein